MADETPELVVLRNKNTHVGKAVVPIPEGWSVEDVLNAYSDSWQLDSKTDPADVEVPSPAGPPATTKGK